MMDKGFIYFAEDGDAIKIGFAAVSVKRRIDALRVGNAREVKLLGWISPLAHDE